MVMNDDREHDAKRSTSFCHVKLSTWRSEKNGIDIFLMQKPGKITKLDHSENYKTLLRKDYNHVILD